MKRIIAVLAAFAIVFAFAACGEPEQEEVVEKTPEVALICEGNDVNDGSFNQATWYAIRKACEKRDLACTYYETGETSDDAKANKEATLKTVETAVNEGVKVIVFGGSDFCTAAYDAQKKFEDVHFLLIDGIPHNEDNDYVIGDNTIGVMFAEEEAGYLAGYAAVIEGYKNLGFMGGKEVPSVKRFGYGFVQGARDAAEKSGAKDLKLMYGYSGTFSASDKVAKEAAGWYKDGTEVIFACGGGIGKSVMQAAEENKGKVIGVDVNQAGLSETVITSAKKGITTAVGDLLAEYARDNLAGGNVFNFSVSNDGVGLEMKNSRLEKFTSAEYNRLIKLISEGKTKIKKDTDVDSPEELAGKNIEVNIKTIELD